MNDPDKPPSEPNDEQGDPSRDPNPDPLFEGEAEQHPTAETSATPPYRIGGPTRSWSGLFGAVVPDRIGSYTLTRIIGVGGMGTVFEAVQDNPRRAVALKIIKAGAASEPAMRRFQTEAAVLARLHHPFITQVYEAGTHESSIGPVPFIAMELVGGSNLPLTVGALAGSGTAALGLRARGGESGNAPDLMTYSRRHTLTIAQRLELIMRVCEGVQHAHDHNVIHRDLKPANILVDETGVLGDTRPPSSMGFAASSIGLPKIIDFGIARAMDPDGSAAPLHTTQGHPIGTLAYMSPEQTIGDARRIDHRTDVYSLGVILYELLTGKLPYPTSGGGVSSEQGARHVREMPPVLPSKVDRSLRGDVENIVLKALRKDRAERYQTVAEMRDDLKRVLAGKAALAKRIGPLRAALRVAKSFAGRKPVLASAGAGLFAIGLAGVAVENPRLQWPNNVFQQFLIHQPVQVDRFSKVCLITVDNGFDVESALEETGFSHLDLNKSTSLRPIYAAFLRDKLAKSGTPAIAFDITFEADSPDRAADLALAQTITDLAVQTPPIPVVVTYDIFNGVSAKPEFCSVIQQSGVRYGSPFVQNPPNAMWSGNLFSISGNEPPRPAMAAVVAASAASPQLDQVYSWDAHAQTLNVQFRRKPTTELPSPALERGEPLRFITHDTAIYQPQVQEPVDDVATGLQDGDFVAHHVLVAPSNRCIRRSTLSLTRAWEMSPEELRSWIDGRVVLIANYRSISIRPPIQADVLTYVDGRKMPGPCLQAAFVESLMGGASVHWPTGWYGWVIFSVCGVIGLSIAWFIGRPVRALMAIVLASMTIVVLAVLAFRSMLLVTPPFFLVLAAVISFTLVRWIARERRARLI